MVSATVNKAVPFSTKKELLSAKAYLSLMGQGRLIFYSTKVLNGVYLSLKWVFEIVGM